MNLHDLHRRSSSLVSQELAALGFKLRYGDVDRVLYPHFLTHPVGIGTFHSIPSSENQLFLIGLPPDLHEPESERSQEYVRFAALPHGADAIGAG